MHGLPAAVEVGCGMRGASGRRINFRRNIGDGRKGRGGRWETARRVMQHRIGAKTGAKWSI